MTQEIKEGDKVYIETKEDCQRQIDAAGTVCSRCAGVITPIETVDNSGRPTYWMGCEVCGRFDYGVPKLIYDIAKRLVTERNFVPYRHMDYPADQKGEEYKKYWTESQIGGATSIVTDVLRIQKQLTEEK